MSMLQKALEGGKFAVTAEMAPPKGYDFSEQMASAELLRGKVHAVNVTDMQSACLKASSLGLCIHLKQAGLEPILQMTGRDRSRMALMADVLSAASFGIDTMLALTGDHPAVGDCRDSKPVYDLDSVGILHMLSRMEETGADCGGNALEQGAPKFFKGAAVTPVYEPLPLQINKLRQKEEAGAQYIQTQGIFDLESLQRFLEAVDQAGIRVPIMAGIIPLKSAGNGPVHERAGARHRGAGGADRPAGGRGPGGKGQGRQGTARAAGHGAGGGAHRRHPGQKALPRRPHHGHRRGAERPRYPGAGRGVGGALSRPTLLAGFSVKNGAGKKF